MVFYSNNQAISFKNNKMCKFCSFMCGVSLFCCVLFGGLLLIFFFCWRRFLL